MRRIDVNWGEMLLIKRLKIQQRKIDPDVLVDIGTPLRVTTGATLYKKNNIHNNRAGNFDCQNFTEVLQDAVSQNSLTDRSFVLAMQISA